MKKKQLMTIGALASLLVTNTTQFAYAANTTKDSIGSQNTNDDGINIGVDETQDKKTTYSDSITSDSEQETYVYVSQASTFSVKIPKLIVLSGEKTEDGINKGEYIVSVNGNIGGQETIDVVPSESFAMTQLGKKDIIATVEQEKTSWANNEMDTISKGVVSTSDMTAGSWNGNFNFDIKLKSNNSTNEIKTFTFALSNTTYIAKENMTWQEWINSEYNVDAYRSYGETSKIFTATTPFYVVNSQGTIIYANDTIDKAETYSTTYNGVIEEEPEESVATISFMVGGTECIAEKDMTWLEWVTSDYNTINACIAAVTEGDCVLLEDEMANGEIVQRYIIDGDTFEKVLIEDKIVSEKMYELLTTTNNV